jgi:hypothetical protein
VTDRRDFKRRVRARQAQTGESYTEAHKQVTAARPRAMSVVDLRDISDAAARMGFECAVTAQDELLARVPAETLLRRLHSVLVAVDGDDETAVMRRLAFHGETPSLGGVMASTAALRAFYARAKAGMGGSFGGGRLIVLYDAVPIIYVAWPQPPMAVAPRAPRIAIMTLDGFRLEVKPPV